MNSIEELIAARQKEKEREAAFETAKTGGLAGAVLGGAGSIIGGAKSLPKVLMSALAGGGAGAALGGGSQLVGNALMGSPDDDDPGAYGTRGGIGGAVAGGLGGATLGGLLGAGKLKWLSKVGPIARGLEEEGPLNNIVSDKIRQWMARGKGAAPKTAATLGLAGALLGGEHGAGEGMQVDYLRSHKRDEDESY